VLSVIRPGDCLVVIADNCADDTAQEARRAGAVVLERTGGYPGKGCALAWFASNMGDLAGSCDVVVILDADSRLEAGFCQAVQERMESGVDVVQAFIQPEAVEEDVPSMLAAYSELLSQLIDDEARMRLGWTVALRGTGMAIRTTLFRDAVEMLSTQVDDAELTILLVMRRLRIVYEPSAKVIDPKAASLGGLARQRGRWLKGQRQVWHRNAQQVLRVFLYGPPGWSLVQSLLFKPKTMMILIRFLLLCLPLGWGRLDGAAIGLFCFLSGTILVDLLYYLGGLRLVSRPAAYFRVLLKAPVYVVVWFYGWVLSLRRGSGWLRARGRGPAR
jgi:cellulose synthase/poly-beta-1,6-N-acetylglucosamine synthase-like glycosyltransferase